MATFKFTGRVLPSSSNMTLKGSISTRWEDPSLGLAMDASLSIANSVVEVLCESNLFGTENHDGHVHFRASDMARAVVNSFAYAKGLGLSVVLESVTKPDGVKYNIQDQRPDLAALVTAFRSGPEHGSVDLADMLQIVFSDPMIFVSLNDLVSSITLPQYAPVNCGRVIEALPLPQPCDPR